MLFYLNSKAQDPNFSQYFSSPLILNPANTGNFLGKNRSSFQYRNQWQGIGDPYITGTGSFETKILKNTINEGILSFGINGLYDKTAAGLLKSNYVSFSIGYHIFTDNSNESKLSVGFQSTLVSKKLDFENITFADQFSSYGFNLTLPNNQNFQNKTIFYSDWNSGMMYSNEKESYSFYIGMSTYHLTKPRESFLNDNSTRIPIRSTIHGGFTLHLSNNGKLFTSGMINKQGTSSESLIGMVYGVERYVDYKQFLFLAGTWYRMNENIIPYLGYMFKNFQLGLSFDVNVTNKFHSNFKNRSFELSMVYHNYNNSEFNRLIQNCKF